jgi:hypothetical protein
MRLRQEFRLRHRTLVIRRAAKITAWALATAAVLVGAVSWRNWQRTRNDEAQNREALTPDARIRNTGSGTENVTPGHAPVVTGVGQPETLMLASYSGDGDFTALPGTVPADSGDAAIVRVRMQRGALGALGLPVNEENAGEWIQVDLLIGDDGLPEAVRLVR